MTRPAIKEKYGPQPFTKGYSRSDVWTHLARGYGKHLDRWTYTDEQLVVTATNRLNMERAAVERSGTALGRLANWIMREDPHYVEFSGVHLGQLLERGGFDIPDAVRGDRTYLVRRDIVESCLAEKPAT